MIAFDRNLYFIPVKKISLVKNYRDVKFILAAVASAAKQPHKKLMFPSREKLCHTKIYASSSGRQHQCLICFLTREQELSYRKQIARQLRTQYVEGIHGPKYYTVTLKSRLRVSQVQWKRNHWTDHTRLSISRVI